MILGWRVGKVTQVIPGIENQYLARRAKRFPPMRLPTTLLTTSLVQTICQCENLVNVQCEKGEQVKIHAEMIRPMTIILLDMIPLIFQSITTCILPLPTTTTSTGEKCYIRMCHDSLRYPALVREDTFMFIFVTQNKTRVKRMDPQGLLLSVKRNVMQPGRDMLMALLIDQRLFWHSADTIGVEPGHHTERIGRFGYT